ncbi:hypothetical protein J6590_091505 [Homalodisca vitripennis]|nr:hypothetical protein J6590_091505 [Homalodisca vitripennis]
MKIIRTYSCTTRFWLSISRHEPDLLCLPDVLLPKAITHLDGVCEVLPFFANLRSCYCACVTPTHILCSSFHLQEPTTSGFHTSKMEMVSKSGGQVSAQQAFLFLETILEETSDDLRSDSSCSGPAGWPDSDYITSYVIVTESGGQVSAQQAFLFLETILEETSDDLRSDSSCSGPAGWPDSDYITSYVIVTESGGQVSAQQAFLFLETILEETSDDLRSDSSCSGPAGWPDSDYITSYVIVTESGGQVSAQQAFLFLETILEETSDDLRSESSCSGPAGWPDSDSDTASVIHVCNLESFTSENLYDTICPNRPRISEKSQYPCLPLSLSYLYFQDNILEWVQLSLIGRISEGSLLAFMSLSFIPPGQHTRISEGSLLAFMSLSFIPPGQHTRDSILGWVQLSLIARISEGSLLAFMSLSFIPPGQHTRVGVGPEWSGSERDLAVPCKRRRHNSDPGVHDDDGDTDDRDEGETVTSRSSSLLQFETLERHCEDVFRTTATAEPFPPSPSHGSSTFSFDSLETSRWRFCGSQDSLEDDAYSETSSSDASGSSDDAINRSFSSRSGGGSFRSSSGIRSFRSFDSLVLCQNSEKSENSFLSGELSQSLNNTSLTGEEQEPVPTPRGMYKTVECLTEVAPHVACSRTPVSLPPDDTVNSNRDESKDTQDVIKGSERSAENLSEDSGFGEHMSTSNLTHERAVDESAGSGGDSGTGSRRGWDATCDARAKYNRVNWQSAPDLAVPPQCERRTSVPNLYSFAGSKSLVINYVQRQEDEEIAVIPETKSFTVKRDKMASTPDLFSTTEAFLAHERRSELRQSTGSLPRGKYGSASRLSTTTGSSRGSRGSNIQITTSFVNLANSGSNSGSVRGVHFCPVVSEVSWQETSSGSDSDSRDEDDFRTGSESSTPPFEQLVERLRASPVRKPAYHTDSSAERRRVIEELHALKLEKEKEKAPPRRHVGPASAPSPQSLSVPSERPAMEEQPVKKKQGLGGFFQRFSFRRLSGRDKKKDKKKKTLVNSSTSTQSHAKVRDRDEEDFKIIPLHPPGASAVPPPTATPAAPAATPQTRRPQPSPVMATLTATRGLLETDLDSDIAPANKKTRSLLNLDNGRNALKPCPVQREDSKESDSRAKSMEFLLDKENQAAIQVSVTRSIIVRVSE